MTGLRPRAYRDHRRYDFHRTFKKHVKAVLGAVGGQIPDFELPLYANPKQNAPDAYWGNPALPEGCTGFAQAHIAENYLHAPVDPKFIYDNTILVSGYAGAQTLKDSFKAATVKGMRLLGETAADALSHRMAPYFEVRPAKGQDWYDAILAACFANQAPVSVGTTWPSQFESVGAGGVQTFIASAWIGGHDHCFIGRKTVQGEERLIDLSWNGEAWGDRGRSYFTRQQVNAMMSIKGSDALTSRILTTEEVKTVWMSMLIQLDVLQLVVSLYQRLLTTLKS